MPPATYILHMNFTLLLVDLADLLINLAVAIVNIAFTREFALFTRESAHLLVIIKYGNQLRPPTWEYS
ncbi:hypothetical protein [Peribacillus frigoritolerans]|uniref:hypothetical protein n=1 Tax=Peribacillus frigoritolerans TaxID=450367 RepID=UPI002280314C|nr:hypothetical protein [Peribacillus frigoritolerans]MCY9003085.1 hypothetical protein [Peribacillus frigoritolerans]